ncbi:9242_t:CDS:2, partial [Racocetra persica]
MEDYTFESVGFTTSFNATTQRFRRSIDIFHSYMSDYFLTNFKILSSSSLEFDVVSDLERRFLSNLAIEINSEVMQNQSSQSFKNYTVVLLDKATGGSENEMLFEDCDQNFSSENE